MSRRADPAYGASVAVATIDEYLAGIQEPHRSTLEEVRRRIRRLVPESEERISYAVPAFVVQGKRLAGLAAFRNHLSYLPHSGSVLPALADELTGYETTKSALHFPVDQPLPEDLLRLLLDERMRQAGIA